MKQQYKITLLTDIIINQKAATEGSQKTLDFIPGNSFLGIAASIYNQLNANDQITAFHSRKVKFGDAHPCKVNRNGDLCRAIRIPTAMCHPKLKSPEEQCYIHHFYNRHNDLDNLQLRQCRNGFYIESKSSTDHSILEKIDVDKNYAIKSAYDRDKRRAKDENMYAYQSIQKGTIFCFEVDIDASVDKTLIEQIDKALTGPKRIGRSSTAQYGLVEIEPTTYISPSSTKNGFTIDRDLYYCVYADSRLIFLDQYGCCTFTPSAEELGIPNGTIDWSKSQIRTFQYAPWNNRRQARDTDRCGIEKGSVFIIRANGLPEKLPTHVGKYQNEGFGKVIYNPTFLNEIPSTNGVAQYKVLNNTSTSSLSADTTHCSNINISSQLSTGEQLLLSKLRSHKQEQTDIQIQYKYVKTFINDHLHRYCKDITSAQWGTIRSIAMTSKTKQELLTKLFDPVTGFLLQGVSKKLWADQQRCETLSDFIHSIKNEHLICNTIINLAAEMAKRSNKIKSHGKIQ